MIFFLSFTFPFALDLIQQLIDAFPFFLNPIAHEMNLGRARQIQRKSQLLAHERRRVLQRCQRRLVLIFIPRTRDVNTRRALVRRRESARPDSE